MYSDNDFRPTILVVDDDPKVITFIKGVFSPRGYSVLTASNGDDAIRLVEKLYDEIDLILLDLRMPKTDGIEVLRCVKKNHPDIPVGVLTALRNREKECIENGASFFMVKPYALGELVESVERSLKKREQPKEEIEMPQGHIPSAKILIVDNEEMLCETLKERLEEGLEISYGEYKVEVAYDGLEGIEKNKAFGPDIIIADIKMPHMNGDEMIVVIEREGPKPKDYIILTAVDEEEDLRKIRRSGRPSIRKPFDMEEFLQDLRKLCFKHKLTRKL